MYKLTSKDLLASNFFDLAGIYIELAAICRYLE